MKKYISDYISQVEKAISKENITTEELNEILNVFMVKISQFQHERLIHLIVTVLFAALEMSAIYVTLIAPSVTSIVLCVMFLILLVPYIMHYYFLENSVQKMYTIEDRIRSMIKQG